MLSLFFGVGIYRILRYGSSNTSIVDSVFGPRFFRNNCFKNGTLRTKNY